MLLIMKINKIFYRSIYFLTANNPKQPNWAGPTAHITHEFSCPPKMLMGFIRPSMNYVNFMKWFRPNGLWIFGGSFFCFPETWPNYIYSLFEFGYFQNIRQMPIN